MGKSDFEWAPYFVPILGFAVAVTIADAFPNFAAAGLAARVAVPAGLFLFFARRGCYPELSKFRPGSTGALLDILLGLAVMCVWVAPFLIWQSWRPDASEAFDPAMGGEAWRPALLALRLAGFALVTPFIEELLVRSYLIRVVDVYHTHRSFREMPIGHFAWKSFLFTVAWFTFTHATWEWPVACVTGVIYNLWLYRRKHIGSLILAHAVTNAALFLLVVGGSGRIPDGHGSFFDLWFFL
jgi:CAAX prenyl protease-like protein